MMMDNKTSPNFKESIKTSFKNNIDGLKLRLNQSPQITMKSPEFNT